MQSCFLQIDRICSRSSRASPHKNQPRGAVAARFERAAFYRVACQKLQQHVTYCDVAARVQGTLGHCRWLIDMVKCVLSCLGHSTLCQLNTHNKQQNADFNVPLSRNLPLLDVSQPLVSPNSTVKSHIKTSLVAYHCCLTGAAKC